MIAPQNPVRRKKPDPAWHKGFMAMLPKMRRLAFMVFRHLDKEAQEEAVAETIAHALVAYVGLFEQDKVDVAYPTVLARYGARRVKIGRRVATKASVRDVSSAYCQLSKSISVDRLDRHDADEGWREILIEDRHAGPAETTAARIDMADWFDRMSLRDRQIAEALAIGNGTGEVAKQFQVQPSRISQKRREYLQSWKTFQGEQDPLHSSRCPFENRPS